MKKISGLWVIIGVTLLLNGCATFSSSSRVGNARIISGRDDSVYLEKRAPYQQAWLITYKVVYSMGLIRLQEDRAGRLEALIKDSDVIVTVSQLKSRRIRIDIKASKNQLPEPALARKIAQRIKEQW
jgi:hypothetical protein